MLHLRENNIVLLCSSMYPRLSTKFGMLASYIRSSLIFLQITTASSNHISIGGTCTSSIETLLFFTKFMPVSFKAEYWDLSCIYCTQSGSTNLSQNYSGHFCRRHFLAVHDDPVMAANILQICLYKIEKWLRTWRIKVNKNKSIQITFTNRQRTCSPITFNRVQIPQDDQVKYLGLHLDD